MTSSKRTFFVFVPDDTITYGITCDQFWVHELYFEFLFLPSSSQYDRAACQAFVIKLEETINYKSTTGLIQPRKQFKVHQRTSRYLGGHQTSFVIKIKCYISPYSCYNRTIMLHAILMKWEGKERIIIPRWLIRRPYYYIFYYYSGHYKKKNIMTEPEL